MPQHLITDKLKQELLDNGATSVECFTMRNEQTARQTNHYWSRGPSEYAATTVIYDKPMDLARIETREPFDEHWASGGVNRADTKRRIALGMATDRILEIYDRMRGLLESDVDRFINTMPSTRRRRVRREEGAELDIDRLMTGDPQHWESRVRGAKRRHIRLGVACCYSASEGDETYAKAAAYGCAAADVLERLGYAVSLSAVAWSQLPHTGSGVLGLVRVDLKHTTQRLDTQSILTTGLTGFSRRHVFGVYDRINGGSYHWNSGIHPITQGEKEALGIDYLVSHSRQTHSWHLPEHMMTEGFRQLMDEIQATDAQGEPQ